MMKLENVSMSFQKKEVLRNVELTLENKVYGLLGTNGSGKTTLLRIMTGLLSPKEGQVIKDKDYMIGYLPQKFGLFKELTLQKQMEYFCCLKDIDETQWQNEIDRTLKLVNMEEYRKQKCKSLSGGMVRRVGIAQALLGKPDLIIFDEPTTGLDPEERLRFQSVISMLKNQTIIISTHIVDDIDSLCNQLLVLKEKNLYQFDDIEEFIHSVDGEVFVNDIMDENKDILIKQFTYKGQIYYRFLSQNGKESVEPTLEDAYISFIRSDAK